VGTRHFLRGWEHPVGLSTCAAYSRSQYQSFWRAESRRRLIWWSRTLDTLSTVEMCPVVAAASVGRVRTFRGFTQAAAKRSQVALEDPALRARLGTGAGRVHRTCAIIAALSRVCTDQMSRTTTLAETKRQVLISGKRSAGRKFKGSAGRKTRGSHRSNPPTREPAAVGPSSSATYSRSQNQSFLACRGSSSPHLVVENPRQVVNRRNVPGGRRCVRGAGPAFRVFAYRWVRAEQKRDDKIRDVR
jgi:hypothetical protein